MDFNYDPRVVDAVATMREFVVDELYPLEQTFLGQPFSAIEPTLHDKREMAISLGLFAPHIAQEHGGAGFSLWEFAPMSEVLGGSPLGHYVFNCQAPDAGNMEILIEHGSSAQKEKYLKPLIRGQIRSCFSMTEPDAPGANPTWMNTTAVQEGDSWVINGRKWFTTAADGAEFAIVMAVTDPEQSKYARASQIIVPIDSAGLTNVRNISVMGEAGDGYASHSELEYRDVRVPLGNLLGGQGAGFLIAQNRLGPGRIHHCMRWIGICERALDLMCQRAAARELKPGKPLGTRQIVQAWIAESRADIDAARLMVMNAAWKITTESAQAARVEISTIKFFVAGVMQRVLDRAIQVHGALGVTDDTPLAYWYRHERAARIYDGPDEVHKIVVARAILKNYGLRISS